MLIAKGRNDGKEPRVHKLTSRQLIAISTNSFGREQFNTGFLSLFPFNYSIMLFSLENWRTHRKMQAKVL